MHEIEIAKLIGLLDSPHPAMRREACRELARADPRAVEALVAAAAVRRPEVRAMALEALRDVLPDGEAALAPAPRLGPVPIPNTGRDWARLVVTAFFVLLGGALSVALIVWGAPDRDNAPPDVTIPRIEPSPFPQPPDLTLPEPVRPGPPRGR